MINLPAEFGRVSKTLPFGPRAALLAFRAGFHSTEVWSKGMCLMDKFNYIQNCVAILSVLISPWPWVSKVGNV